MRQLEGPKNVKTYAESNHVGVCERCGKVLRREIKKSDYYAKELGPWDGKGADRLGHKGEVTSNGDSAGVRLFRGNVLRG